MDDRLEEIKHEVEHTLRIVPDASDIILSRSQVEWLIEALEASRRENERLRGFLAWTPSPEAFNASNALELYEAWETQGVMDRVMERLAERDRNSIHPT